MIQSGHNFSHVTTAQGWGLLSQFPPFHYFPKFSSLPKHTLTVKYRIYIWQVSPQLSCGDTCQIWMWFKESNMYFCEIENFAYRSREINKRSFSNPDPCSHGMRKSVSWSYYHFTHIAKFSNGLLSVQDRCTSIVNLLRPRVAYMRQWPRPSLVQIMACRLLGAKPLSEPMLTYCQLDHKEQNQVKY